MPDPHKSSLTRPARPIFVVGSPRSGTSVLAWCLGHHPNIFPVPESNWMGDFAVSVAIAHQIGSAREDRSMLSAMDIGSAELFAALGHTINDLTLRHRRHLQTERESKSVELGIQSPWLAATSTAAGPKTRWVDGTPEYSLHICGLRKLFPDALFIHLVRDVDSVVRSLLNFHRVSGSRLVANEEEAYKYWLRTVKACVKAEQAYGPQVVRRLLYSNLLDNAESALRSLLEFVGEPYSAKCLEPLAERINSSNVPPDFRSDDPATDPAVVAEARRLWYDVERTAQGNRISTAAAEELEAAFEQSRVRAKTIEQDLKSQIANQQNHYLTEIEAYKSKVLTQQQHYLAEIEEYKQQINTQQQQHDAEVEGYKLQIARQEQHYTNEVCRRVREISKLAGLLEQVVDIVTRLRSSRFWRLANRAAAMEAKLSRGKAPVPDSKLEKILARYSRWRASHPEIAKSEQESNMETATNQGETTTKRLTGDDPAVERIAVSETR
jgi:Sulfotransferase family